MFAEVRIESPNGFYEETKRILTEFREFCNNVPSVEEAQANVSRASGVSEDVICSFLNGLTKTEGAPALLFQFGIFIGLKMSGAQQQFTEFPS